jgi:formylglycine-generating enzyme required for sulfatase activity
MDRRAATAEPLFLEPGVEPVPGYTLLQALGKGGFGEVWKAQGPGGFAVALKCIRLAEPTSLGELQALEEVRKIQHPHLLSLFGAWQRQDMLLIAMELARGTLQGRLRQAVEAGQPGIPFPELLDYLRDAARALDYLNDQNLPHRDVKPPNLLLVGDGVKLADFGLSKVLEHAVRPSANNISPTYAAPELFDHKPTRWSDQYSLAVTYCQLRGNALPFTGSPVQLMLGHLDQEPDLGMIPARERPHVRRALAKKPEERWPTCRKFVEALSGVETVAAVVAAEPPRSDPQVSLRPFDLRLKPVMPVVVKPGTRHLLPVQVERIHCPGRIELRLDGLPDGVSHQTEGIRAEATEGTIAITIPAQTRPVESTARLVVRGAASVEVALPFIVEQPSWVPVVTNMIGMKLAIVPAGRFLMGSPHGEEGHQIDEEPQHEVDITRPFYLGVHPVTQTQFELIMGRNPAFFTRERGGGPDHPVEQVTWQEAGEFCQRLSDLPQEKAAQRVYRLPTEAEWEYACRAGSHGATTFGPTLNSTQANFNGNFPYSHAAKGIYRFRTTKIGTYRPNAWGLHDMHGNVWEWCWDWYDPNYYSYSYKRDPKGGDPNAEKRKVVRGGSWYDQGPACRSAARNRFPPGDRSYTVGFRVVLDVVPGMKCG